jgi:hypothetical protein
MQRACAAAAELEGARVTAQAFQTSAAPGAAIATCTFHSQTEDSYRWTGVTIRTQGEGGLRVRASFTARDPEVRRNAAQHLSAILARLVSAVRAPQTPRPPRRPAPPPPAGTTI